MLAELAEVAHRLLLVELEEGERAVVAAAEHHLAPVGLVRRGRGVGAAPAQLPPLAEVVLAVELMGHQLVDVEHVVAAHEVVPLGVETLAAHVGVDGVAGIEEGVAHAVALAQGHPHVGQRRHLELRGEAVVGILVGHGARTLEDTRLGVVHALRAVVDAARGEDAQRLASHLEVVAPGDVAAEGGERGGARNREVGVEDVLRADVVAVLRKAAAHRPRVDPGRVKSERWSMR